MTKLKSLDSAIKQAKAEERLLKEMGTLNKDADWLMVAAMEKIEEEIKSDNWRPCPYGIEPKPLIKLEPEPVKVTVSTGKGIDDFVDKHCYRVRLEVDGKHAMTNFLSCDPIQTSCKRLCGSRDDLRKIGWEMYYQNNPDKRPAKKASWLRALWEVFKWLLLFLGAYQLIISLIKHAG